jgi:hypothetical protein
MGTVSNAQTKELTGKCDGINHTFAVTTGTEVANVLLTVTVLFNLCTVGKLDGVKF